jgi:hypothetical protein
MSGASITANTIPSSAIVGGVVGGGASLSTANTWTALQTFNSGIGLPTSIPSVISGNKIGTTIYGATNVTGANNAGDVMANLTLSPANSVWLVSYSFAFYSSNSAYPATSACNVYIRNDSGSSPQIFGITNFPNGSILTTWNDQCAVITVGSTTSSNNFKLQHTIAASGTIQWLFLNFWGTRIA